jgi:ABC-type sulfate/molybdate transport systems ATPase subunit
VLGLALEVDILKSYRGFRLDVKFEAEGRYALMGASGSGKSLTLQAIAGVITPDKGRIALDDTVLFDSALGINLPPQKRGVGLMFQDYALFPTMTVMENIACGLRAKKPPDARQRVQALMQKLRLTGLERLFPAQLSGGQQQRVALARILASEPRLILLDEPFSALDNHLRWQMEREVAETLEGFSGLSLMVTHDFSEAFRLCEHMSVLDGGRVCASGDKWSLYDNPKTLAAAQMTGCRNIVKAEKTGANHLLAVEWGIELASLYPVPDGVRYVGVRADAIREVDEASGVNAFSWRADGCVETPEGCVLEVALGAAPLRWELSREDFLRLRRLGQGALQIPPERVHPLTH